MSDGAVAHGLLKLNQLLFGRLFGGMRLRGGDGRAARRFRLLRFRPLLTLHRRPSAQES
jgi:hypothetical protein